MMMMMMVRIMLFFSARRRLRRGTHRAPRLLLTPRKARARKAAKGC